MSLYTFAGSKSFHKGQNKCVMLDLNIGMIGRRSSAYLLRDKCSINTVHTNKPLKNISKIDFV